MEFTIKQIAGKLGGTVKGDDSLTISRLSKIQEATEGSLAFLSNPKYENYLYSTKATAVLVKSDFELTGDVDTNLIFVDDPYIAFTFLIEEYQKAISFVKSGVEDPSYIGEGSATGDGIYRGAFSYIGTNVQIGKNVKIYPHAYIGDNSVIGDNCLIYSGVKIYSDSRIGSHCVLHAGAVIGSDGFGYAPLQDGTYKAIPQLGNVVLEDNVHIGANTTIDCATLLGDSTVIKDGAKLDNLVMIAHNVVVGEDTVIAAQSGISGSSKIGKNCIIAGQVGIVGHIEIPDKTTIAAQSGITKNWKKENLVLLGSPAFEKGDYARAYAIFRRLPDLNQRIKLLEEKILNLPAI